jgi:protein SCO1
VIERKAKIEPAQNATMLAVNGRTASIGRRASGGRWSGWCALLMLGFLGLPMTARATDVPSAARVTYLPNVTLVDQSGKSRSLAAFKGRPALVGFIHTSCEGICEMLTAKMKSIAEELNPSFNTKVSMLSVTTDPKEDGPAQLAAYAKKQGTFGQGWFFFTGPEDQVDNVLKVYGVPAGDPGDELTHVLKIYLISPDGRELHVYNGMDIAPSAVAADIRNALARR